MKDCDVRSVVETYCSIAKLKEAERTSKFYSQGKIFAREVVATHVFGAQQLAWFYWSESGLNLDIFKVNVLLAFHEIGDIHVPSQIKAFIDEYNENTTGEARFAHMCSDLEDWLHSVSPVCTVELVEFIKGNYLEFLVDFDDLKNVIRHYDILSVLKYKTRRGWIYWNVNVPHREVVSEHVFGTQSLAWLIYLASESKLNIYKITAMMALHETEESIMEDFTPYDPITPEEMLAMGKVAVAQALGGLKQCKMITALIDEFNKKETPDSKFAYLCDKLECNFRAKMYSDLGLCTIEGGQDIVRNDPEIKKNIAKGAKNVSDLFFMHEMHKYVGTDFEEIANCLKGYDTSK